MTTISMKLQIWRGENGGLVFVPNCEPVSSISSTKLSAEIRDVCNGVTVSVNKILENIPGSYVEMMPNFGFNTGSHMLVLPASIVGCPCPRVSDWYNIIRGLADPPSTEEAGTQQGECSAFGLHECDSEIRNDNR